MSDNEDVLSIFAEAPFEEALRAVGLGEFVGKGLIGRIFLLDARSRGSDDADFNGGLIVGSIVGFRIIAREYVAIYTSCPLLSPDCNRISYSIRDPKGWESDFLRSGQKINRLIFKVSLEKRWTD